MLKLSFLSLILVSTVATAYVPLINTVKTNLVNPADITMDSQNQLYYISNMNGEATRKNNRGFISRLKLSDQTLANEVIIKGGEQKVVLNAPKGILFSNQRLYVADIDTVRIFKRGRSGWTTEKNIPIRGAMYLNQITMDSNNNLWISDTGMNTIFRLSPPYGQSFPRRYFFNKIPTPTGICIDKDDPDTLWITSYTSTSIYKASLSKNKVLKKFQTRALSLGSLIAVDGNKIISTNQESGQALMFTLSQKEVIRKPINKKMIQAPGGIFWNPLSKLYLISDTVNGELHLFQETALPVVPNEK